MTRLPRPGPAPAGRPPDSTPPPPAPGSPAPADRVAYVLDKLSQASHLLRQAEDAWNRGDVTACRTALRASARHALGSLDYALLLCLEGVGASRAAAEASAAAAHGESEPLLRQVQAHAVPALGEAAAADLRAARAHLAAFAAETPTVAQVTAVDWVAPLGVVYEFLATYFGVRGGRASLPPVEFRHPSAPANGGRVAHGARKTAVLVPVLLLGVAAALRLPGLGALSLWTDEAYSAALSTGPFADVVWHQEADHVPGYFLLLWGVAHLFGDSEVVLRAPSAIAGALAVLGTWAIGWLLGRPRAAVVGALVVALSPICVYWSREAKPEALAMALAVGSTWLLLMARRRTHLAWWLAYWGVSLLGVYTFYVNVLVLAAHQLALLGAWWSHGGRRIRRRALLAPLLVAASLLPWLLLQSARLKQDLPTFGGKRLDPVAYLLFNGNDLLGGDPWTPPVVDANTLAALVFLALLGGLALEHAAWRSDVGRHLLAAWLLVPLVVTYVLQLLVPNYHTRYLLVALPAAGLLLGYAVERLLSAPHVLRPFVGAGLLLLLANWLRIDALLPTAPVYQHEGYREASAFVRAHTTTAAVLVPDPVWLAPGFGYYLRAAGDPTVVVWPAQDYDDRAAFTGRLAGLRARGVVGVWLAERTGEGGRASASLAEEGTLSGWVDQERGVTVRYFTLRP